VAIRLIAGLGNPGREHERDRHNAGFWLVERYALGAGLRWTKESRFKGVTAKAAGDALLVMPQTYMNRSGQSVVALARFFKIAPGETLVVHDELDFPPGTARLKQGGGVAGHNGLKDIAEQFGAPDFWRLRIGIGHPGDRSMVSDWVLSSPSPDDRREIETAIDQCLQVMPAILAGDMQAAMLRLHGVQKTKGAAAGASADAASGKRPGPSAEAPATQRPGPSPAEAPATKRPAPPDSAGGES